MRETFIVNDPELAPLLSSTYSPVSEEQKSEVAYQREEIWEICWCDLHEEWSPGCLHGSTTVCPLGHSCLFYGIVYNKDQDP